MATAQPSAGDYKPFARVGKFEVTPSEARPNPLIIAALQQKTSTFSDSPYNLLNVALQH
jgi:hypothetical protein